MKEKSIKLIRRLTSVILFFSIVSLILLSFLPWIEIKVNGQNKYMNYQMMLRSLDGGINYLSTYLEKITFILWGIIVLSFVTLFGSILWLTKKNHLAILLIFLGTFIVTLCCIVLILDILFYRDVNGLDKVSLAYIFGPVGYAYIFFLFSILQLITSIYLSLTTISFIIDYLSDKKIVKQKESEVIELAKPIVKGGSGKRFISNANMIEKEIGKEEKDIEPKEIGKEEKDIEPKEIGKEEKDIEPKEIGKEAFIENIAYKKEERVQKNLKTKEKEEEIKKEATSLIEKKKKIDLEDKKDYITSKTLENALASVIEKRKKLFPEREKIVQDEKKEMFESGEYKIRCAKCRHIFTIYLKDKNSKIKCPRCGKEGKIKMI